MLTRCNKCGTDFDDDERLTFCPHEAMPMSFPQWLHDDVEAKYGEREQAIRKHFRAARVLDAVKFGVRATLFLFAGAVIAWMSLHIVDALITWWKT